MRLIKFERPVKVPVWINPEFVVGVEAERVNSNLTAIFMLKDGYNEVVLGTPEEVVQRLEAN